METYRDISSFDQGVGATAEADLAVIAPLIEYCKREMGDLPGRLMIAASFLEDAKLMDGWAGQSPEARAGIEKAKALIVSVMVRLLNAQQQECLCADSTPDKSRKEQ